MRLSVQGIKGGTGKSTISLLLASKLAQNELKVLVIDADRLSYLSNLAKIKGNGILVDEDSRENIYDMPIGAGNITLIKLGSADKGNWNAYKKFLSENQFDHYIVDSSGLIRDKLEEEAKAFHSVVKEKETKVYVSTPGSLNNINFSIGRIEKPSWLIINMVPLGYTTNSIDKLNFERILTIPFIEELISFQGSISDILKLTRPYYDIIKL
ncbi:MULTISPECIES: AAA family ATPase [Acidianus]|uniref:CobQ/CobB/MinD/ParA nucleotide binding domain-containing protein n=1 Tax=Candidatus Acidianus copahuensis TaxID=1160895 RepID=A0A031LUA8_9CREN|nr:MULTISPECIES: AAA family ATPase [Acidianus]EZQ10713.1 hypothetical protein CM19_03530 [Candidatus Acidianus copahuensis]NON61287.1 AAA family ATPase [Acidianus sp. RZ1]